MAFASVGSLGSASLKVAGADLTLSPDTNVPAGNLIVIWTAWEIDYSGGVGPEGSVIPNLAITDGTDNVWVTLTSYMFESNAGIHCCRLRTALTTSDTITIHSRNPSRTPKSASMWELTMDPAKVWVRSLEPIVAAVSGGVDLPDVSVSDPAMLSRGEALILHGISVVGPNTDIYTFDPDYTAIDPAGTTGGAVDTNVHVRGGFRITGLTSDTIVQSSDTADRAYDQVVVILGEAEVIPGFPSFPVLDDFNRADEDDLDFGGLWAPSGPFPTACTPNYGGGGLRVSGNRATRSGTAVGGAAQFWAEEFSGCYAEVYATLAERGQLGLHLDSTGCGNDSNLGSYAAYFFPYYGGTGPGSVADDMVDFGIGGFRGPSGGRGIPVWVDLQDNHKLGIQRDSRFQPFLHLYIDRGSGWEWAAALNDSVFFYGDFAPVRLALAHWGDFATFSDDFGGGYGPCPEFWVGMNFRSADRRGHNLRGLQNPSDDVL